MLPVLREVRRRVQSGERILEALFNCTGEALELAHARIALRRAALPFMEISAVHQWGDLALQLWVIDTAIREAGAVHRGGWRVVSGGRAA